MSVAVKPLKPISFLQQACQKVGVSFLCYPIYGGITPAGIFCTVAAINQANKYIYFSPAMGIDSVFHGWHLRYFHCMEWQKNNGPSE